MKRIHLTVVSFVIPIIILMTSCAVEKKNSALEKDAKKFVKIKCENKIILDKYAADTTISLAKFDSIKKALNKNLKDIRNKYKKDSDLEKKFKNALNEAMESMPKCKEIFNKDKKKRKRQRK